MSTLHNRPIEAAYDYIIVGSGSGGAVVARRLTERLQADVLLIEAGPDGQGAALLDDPARWTEIAGSPYDWGYSYAPSDALEGRAIALPRGKVLGGSSATNAMLWYRGHPADYDDWDDQGATGWRFADCLPAFRRSEDWQGGADAWRGAGGPLRIETSPHPHPMARAIHAAGLEMGLPEVADPNGASNEGAALANLNISAGRRFCAATGYLRPVAGARNLTILTGSKAVRLDLDRGRVAGVVHRADGREVSTRARHEVILAAGAIDTPRLLMLSGIGPEAALRALGLPVHLDLPGVGENLQDHPLLQACEFRAATPLGPVRDNGGGTMLNWRSSVATDRPDLHAVPAQGSAAMPHLAGRYGAAGARFSILVGLMRSFSRGRMRMLSADPDGPLDLQPNLLSDPRDLAALTESVGFVQDLAGQPAMADHFAGHAVPDRRLNATEREGFVRAACSSFYHACGTCRMGSDADAVADPTLRLRGIDGLRIADASVIPTIPTCNTHAVVTMIGERAADFIEDAQRQTRPGPQT